jgi:hypothetical protein
MASFLDFMNQYLAPKGRQWEYSKVEDESMPGGWQPTYTLGSVPEEPKSMFGLDTTNMYKDLDVIARTPAPGLFNMEDIINRPQADVTMTAPMAIEPPTPDTGGLGVEDALAGLAVLGAADRLSGMPTKGPTPTQVRTKYPAPGVNPKTIPGGFEKANRLQQILSSMRASPIGSPVLTGSRILGGPLSLGGLTAPYIMDLLGYLDPRENPQANRSMYMGPEELGP